MSHQRDALIGKTVQQAFHAAAQWIDITFAFIGAFAVGFVAVCKHDFADKPKVVRANGGQGAIDKTGIEISALIKRFWSPCEYFLRGEPRC